MPSLYTLTSGMLAVSDLLDESDGELTPDVAALLGELEEHAEAKVDAICEIISRAEAEEARIREKVKAWQALAQTQERKAQRLKEYLRQQMERLGIQKWHTPNNKVRIQKSPPSAVFNGDPEWLPAAFARITKEANRSAALQAWKEGRELPEGFTIVQNQHLRIQ